MKGQGYRSTKKESGALLIEVMVAGMLLVIGVTGLGAAQISALRTVSNADTATRLLFLHGSIFDQLRLHRDAAAAGDLDLEIPHGSRPLVNGVTTSLHDLAAFLQADDIQPYLGVRCGDAPDVRCQVCVGTFSSDEDQVRLHAGGQPVNTLCSTQRTG